MLHVRDALCMRCTAAAVVRSNCKTLAMMGEDNGKTKMALLAQHKVPRLAKARPASRSRQTTAERQQQNLHVRLTLVVQPHFFAHTHWRVAHAGQRAKQTVRQQVSDEHIVGQAEGTVCWTHPGHVSDAK